MPSNSDWVRLLQLDRVEIKSGEYWRFWSGPLVHTTWQHLLVNLAGLAVLQQMLGKELRTASWLWGYGVISLAVGLCMIAFSRFDIVIGLSAVLHGLFAYAACLAMRRDILFAAGVLIVIGGKVVWEKLQGGSSFMEDFIGLPVAADTHLYGFAAGLVLGVIMIQSARFKSE